MRNELPSRSREGGSVREAIRAAARQFEAVSDTARLDAELLMAHALGIERGAMLLDRLDDAAPEAFAALVERRLAHEPVAYILGEREFWSLPLGVGPGALIPRPDTETLIEAALAAREGRAPATILDLGTGSGALLLAALSEWPGARGIGVDRSATALACARDNAARLGLGGRARFVRGDWGAMLAAGFDLVLANPPYVENAAPLAPEVRDHEPGEALFAGADGLDAYRALAPQLARLLAPGGTACVEIGADQAAAAAALFGEAGLKTSLRKDLAGRARCLIIHNSGG